MKLTMTLYQRAQSDINEAVVRSFGNINKDYVSFTSNAPNVPTLPFDADGEQYENFLLWVHAVAGGLNSLSKNTWHDAKVVAEWTMLDE